MSDVKTVRCFIDANHKAKECGFDLLTSPLYFSLRKISSGEVIKSTKLLNDIILFLEMYKRGKEDV